MHEEISQNQSYYFNLQQMFQISLIIEKKNMHKSCNSTGSDTLKPCCSINYKKKQNESMF